MLYIHCFIFQETYRRNEKILQIIITQFVLWKEKVVGLSIQSDDFVVAVDHLFTPDSTLIINAGSAENRLNVKIVKKNLLQRTAFLDTLKNIYA